MSLIVMLGGLFILAQGAMDVAGFVPLAPPGPIADLVAAVGGFAVVGVISIVAGLLVLVDYERQIRSGDLGGRVRELAVLRDKEGYMAEVRQSAKGRYELFEFNCPILAVADKYWEACKVENELFRRVLKADVDTTHRVVAGDHVCRFLIKPRTKAATA